MEQSYCLCLYVASARMRASARLYVSNINTETKAVLKIPYEAFFYQFIICIFKCFCVIRDKENDSYNKHATLHFTKPIVLWMNQLRRTAYETNTAAFLMLSVIFRESCVTLLSTELLRRKMLITKYLFLCLSLQMIMYSTDSSTSLLPATPTMITTFYG